MIVLTNKIDVEADLVHDLDIDFFKAVGEARLVDPLLHRVQVKS